MANFNENIVNTDEMSVKAFRELGMALQGFLTDEEYELLHLDWFKANTRTDDNGNEYKLTPKDKDFIPYWKFCLENIKVSYGE